MRTRILPAMTVLALLAGCLGPAPAPDADGDAAFTFTPGVHPWPRGDEWPAGLKGPFNLLDLSNVKVPSVDGILLDAWLYRPDVPAGTKVPVILWASPYFGVTQPFGNDPAQNDNSGLAEAVPVNFLVENGYAVALVSLRGTGNSGGCYTFFGAEDRTDTAAAVEYFGEQEWSNGRVGMMGLSYHGTTPWMAAVENPSHLKTIVVAGIVSDPYTFFHTPQGAAFTVGPAFSTQVFAALIPPPVTGGPDDLPGFVPVAAERFACPSYAEINTEVYRSFATDQRSAEFWDSRRLIDDFPEVTTSVFLTQGLRDNTGHAFQESAVWNTLHAPKRQMEGQWGHMFPNFGGREDWDQIHLEWFEFWLKGIGVAAPGLGTVEYEDGTEAWHTTTSWPPAEAREEALYLTGGTMATAPAAAPPATFEASRATGGSTTCFLSEPVATDALIAGNPYAYVTLTSDEPGGIVKVSVFDAPASGGCPGPNARELTWGHADLRFHAGNFQGTDFPTGTPARVRVDLVDLAEVVPKGNRIAIVLGPPSEDDRSGQPFAPTIGVEAGADALTSLVVLPFVGGTLGGPAAPPGIPPRPFVPLAGPAPIPAD